MWDLMRGRGAASLALGREAGVVRFSGDGARFAVASDEGVEVYALVRLRTRWRGPGKRLTDGGRRAQDMKPVARITYPRRLLDVEFATMHDAATGADREVLLAGAEDGKTLCYEVGPGSETASAPAPVATGEDADADREDEEADVPTLEAIAVFGGHTNR